MAEKKLARKDFFKYIAGAFTGAGLDLVDSFYKNVHTQVPGGSWVRAMGSDGMKTLPKLIFLQGYWIFIADKGNNAFKALCPHDNGMLQYRLPDNNLFCLRCSRCYCPKTGCCLNSEISENISLNLNPLPLKTTEGGFFIYLEK